MIGQERMQLTDVKSFQFIVEYDSVMMKIVYRPSITIIHGYSRSIIISVEVDLAKSSILFTIAL